MEREQAEEVGGLMVKLGWSMPVADDEAARRAGGRRRYNQRRKRQALERREQVIALVVAYGGYWQWGVKSAIARKLGVSRRTIGRDLAWLSTL